MLFVGILLFSVGGAMQLGSFSFRYFKADPAIECLVEHDIDYCILEEDHDILRKFRRRKDEN